MTAETGTGPDVVLLGMMGSGKSSVGKELARQLGVRFDDLDTLIERDAGMTIPEIFASEGEAAFREREAEALERALGSGDGVLALGGGAAMHPRSQRRLAGHPIVLLEVDESTVARRLGGGRGRPLLSGADPMARWRDLAALREPTYRMLARWTVDSAAGSAVSVARAIIDRVDGATRDHDATHDTAEEHSP